MHFIEKYSLDDFKSVSWYFSTEVQEFGFCWCGYSSISSQEFAHAV